MKIIDDETVPYLLIPRTISYFRWLFKEIVKANFQVVKAVLKPDMEVSPALFRVSAPQKTDIGITMFANSITLTPGTVSIDVEGDEIVVHALLAEMSNPDDFQEMGARAAAAVKDGATPLRSAS